MQPSKSLGWARGIIGLVGIGALVMTVSNVTSGQSVSDPIVPAGLALGLLAAAAAAWPDAPSPWQAVAVWLGLLAIGAAVVVLVGNALRTPSADVMALVAIPCAILIAAGIRVAIARAEAGPLGRSTDDDATAG